ncbi:hypothetical protein EBT31_03625 [bacterium]|nr:hypothetical protein [bacterium]NBX49219.1 hypothetical protein [bacterium]
MAPNPLEKALYRTLAYFAYFRFPLTRREAHAWLLAPDRIYSAEEVEMCINESLWIQRHTDRYQGYISLEECEDWVKEREKKYIDAQRKHRKATRVAALLMRLPGVEGIAVCNSLAWHATHKEGDIDFFIVTKPGRIWNTRLFATIPLRIFGMRPGETIRDPVCLSFFADKEVLAFARLREGEEDWYLAYWAASLRWIDGSQALVEQFFAQNPWIQQVLPHAQPTRMVSTVKVKRARKVPLVVPESFAKRIQQKLFSERIKKKQNEGTHVIINDHMLKFHEEDRRASISAFVRLHLQKAGIV